jgi:hypothetical protein
MDHVDDTIDAAFVSVLERTFGLSGNYAELGEVLAYVRNHCI